MEWVREPGGDFLVLSWWIDSLNLDLAHPCAETVPYSNNTDTGYLGLGGSFGVSSGSRGLGSDIANASSNYRELLVVGNALKAISFTGYFLLNYAILKSMVVNRHVLSPNDVGCHETGWAEFIWWCHCTCCHPAGDAGLLFCLLPCLWVLCSLIKIILWKILVHRVCFLSMSVTTTSLMAETVESGGDLVPSNVVAEHCVQD